MIMKIIFFLCFSTRLKFKTVRSLKCWLFQMKVLRTSKVKYPAIIGQVGGAAGREALLRRQAGRSPVGLQAGRGRPTVRQVEIY